MKKLAVALLLFAACSDETPQPPIESTRMPIAIEYVRADSLPVHAAPNDDAPVLTRYENGESVSVLSRKDEWCEVRTVNGSGWAHAADLASAAEARKAEADNLTPRFRVAPSPVTEPGAHGQIHLVATVNADGEILDVKTESNTTGSKGLENKNINALRRARFVPIVRHGQRTPFTYDYHVSY